MKRLLSWSGGKDAAFALLETPVDGLLVTYDEVTSSIPIHDVPLSAIEEQADAIGLPLIAVPLPAPCPNEVYRERVRDAIVSASEIVFGDLFLADIRAWREQFLASIGVRASFPLFGRATEVFARQVLEANIHAVVCAVDDRLDRSFVGRAYDESFLRDLPRSVDPCGENGEFHTFVWDHPRFSRPVRHPTR
jgi:uncharacterized protein (TIGR00290 family)